MLCVFQYPETIKEMKSVHPVCVLSSSEFIRTKGITVLEPLTQVEK
jgi:hypothetical protein